jgi:hypothetical protein
MTAAPSAIDLLKQRDGLSTHHASMRNLWDEAKRLSSPVGPEYLVNDVSAPRLVRQLSAVAVQANRNLAAGLMSWIMPQASDWFKWEPARAVKDNKGVARWLAECSEIAHDILRSSNFYDEATILMLSRNEAGTASIWMRAKEEADDVTGQWGDDSSPLTFEVCQAHEVMVAEDSRGRVDKWFRTVHFTASQAMQEFGDQAPAHAKEAAKKPGNESTQSEYVHVIYRRRQPAGPSAQEQMPWASVWICPREKRIVKAGGYPRQPIFTVRWERWSRRSPYGISPAIIALGEVRGVNYFEMLLTTLAEVAVEPRIQVPVAHDGVVDLAPGGVTKVLDAGTAPKEWAPVGELNWGLEMLERKEKRIQEVFLNDVFAQFAMLERQMTAFEIAQRLTEKLARVAPATNQLNSDFFSPFLETLFHWCYFTGRFPEPPVDAFMPDAFGRLKMPWPEVIQTNRLAREQSAETEQAIMRVAGTLAPFLEVAGPSILDAINLDKLPEVLAIEAGLKTELIRKPDEIAKLRDERAKAQQQQQALELAAKQPELVAGAAQAMGIGGPPA